MQRGCQKYMHGIEKAGVGHMHFGPGAKLDPKTFATHVGSNLLGGVGAGVVGSESYSLLSNQGFASTDLLKNSVAKFALTSVGLDALHLGGARALDKVVSKVKPETPSKAGETEHLDQTAAPERESPSAVPSTEGGDPSNVVTPPKQPTEPENPAEAVHPEAAHQEARSVQHPLDEPHTAPPT